jgi:EPS-associated MarR family transcriptional regulator
MVSLYNPRSRDEHGWPVEDEIHYKLLKVLEESPDVTQRELAARLGVSLGKANYCLRALMGRGWVKMDNFRRSPNKLGYAYLLTPKGIEEKARIAVRFLRHKRHEFDVLKAEIDRLQLEVENNAAESVARSPSGPI